jgi:hypothetical protein
MTITPSQQQILRWTTEASVAAQSTQEPPLSIRTCLDHFIGFCSAHEVESAAVRDYCGFQVGKRIAGENLFPNHSIEEQFCDCRLFPNGVLCSVVAEERRDNSRMSSPMKRAMDSLDLFRIRAALTCSLVHVNRFKEPVDRKVPRLGCSNLAFFCITLFPLLFSRVPFMTIQVFVSNLPIILTRLRKKPLSMVLHYEQAFGMKILLC